MSSRRAKAVGAAWVVAVGAFAFVFAEGLPLLARAVPFTTEKKIADATHMGAQSSPCSQPAGVQALQKVVARLFPLEPGDNKIQIQVQAVRNPQVNAYAVLGGHIYVNQGLIAQAGSPEELAGVLAHEMEHVRHRHVMENLMVRVGAWGALELVAGDAPSAVDLAQLVLSLQYTRGQEHQADSDGLKRLVKAQVSVKGFEDFFDRLDKRGAGGPAFLSDHPTDASRAALAARYLGLPSRPVLTAEEWKALRNICK